MGHEDIATTNEFYVQQEAEELADAVWEAAGNTLGNSGQPEKLAGEENTLNCSGDDRS